MPSPTTRQPSLLQLSCLLLIVGCIVRTGSAAITPSANSGPVPSATQSASFDFDRDREPAISLDGLWRFQPGDDPYGQKGWKRSEFDDSAWRLLRSDNSWSEQGYPGMSGFGWYRFKVVVPGDHPDIALQLGPIMTSYQVFVDGRLVGSVGKMPPNVLPTAAWGYQTFPLVAASPDLGAAPETIQVAIRVWHSKIWASYMGGGPAFSGNLLGDARLLAAEQQHHDASRHLLFVDLFSYAITAFIVSVTVFGLYLFRPKERECILWFAILLMAKCLDASLNIAKEIYAWPAVPVFDLLDGMLVACAQGALLLFLSRVLNLGHGFVFRLLLAMAAVSPLLGILYWPGWLPVPVAALLQVFFLLPSSIWILITLTLGALDRKVTARLLLFPVALVQGLYVADNVVIALNQFGLPVEARVVEIPFVLVPYTMHPAVLAELLFLLAMLAFLIRRFTLARRREERWEGALEAARQVQQILLPEAIPQFEGFAIDCLYRPAELVGGDFFQILPAADGDLVIIFGDVAGKGLPAAMVVSMIVGALRTEVTHSSDPTRLLSMLNERLTGQTVSEPEGGLTTCLAVGLSPATWQNRGRQRRTSSVLPQR